MTSRKTERILNLTICLLVSGRYLPKSQIREAVEGYHDLSDSAFERTFERDKDELRALGVPIEVGSFDAFFDDEPGYRIKASEFELPPVELDADEAAVVGVAARVWQHASVAESTQSALAKLRAAGVEPDTSQLAALEPSVQAREEAFEPLWTAVLDRVRVSFTYRGSEKRTLEPWGMTASQGPLVRDRLRHRPAGHPDVQADPDHRQAPSAVQGRRLRGPRGPRPAGPGPVAGSAGAPPDRHHRGPGGQGPDPAAPSRPADDGGTVGTSRDPRLSTAEVAGVRLPVGFEVLQVGVLGSALPGRGGRPLRR